MSMFRTIWGAPAVVSIITKMASIPAVAQQGQKPNILFIMGDDMGWMQPSIYHRGLMVGETPNIDRIGKGALFVDYVAMQHGSSTLLTKTLPKVAAEMALSVLAYNLTRS